ncbi:MAG: molybdopterin-synthase adenylyltransferase MoeB [Myxococcota bacterium]
MSLSPQRGTLRRAMAPFSREQFDRYKRHLLLDGVGAEGQERLLESKVLIVGAGGLGCPSALYLAAAGVGTLGIADFDRVDVSNLQRQILYGTRDVDRVKVEVAAERLAALNPDVQVERIEEKLEARNAESVVDGFDVVLDGTDTFPSRYLLNDVCCWKEIPLVSGSIMRFEGQVAVFDARRGPCYRCLFPEPPPPELAPNCAEAGVLGVLPGVVGTLQATEVLKLLLGTGEPLIGRLLVYDALAMEFRTFVVPKDPDCAVCGEEPTIREPIDYEQFCSASPGQAMDAEPPGIDPEALDRQMRSGSELLLLDVREQVESDVAQIDGARLLPLGELPDRLEELEPWRDRLIVVHCHHGPRSRSACDMLRSHGFAQVLNLRGGIDRWSIDVDPSVPRY